LSHPSAASLAQLRPDIEYDDDCESEPEHEHEVQGYRVLKLRAFAPDARLALASRADNVWNADCTPRCS
jgi:hypothetical protein